MTPPRGPEAEARKRIDADLVEAGWKVEGRDEIDLTAGRGVASLEFKIAKGHDFADYLLFVDAKAVGALEAKKEEEEEDDDDEDHQDHEDDEGDEDQEDEEPWRTQSRRCMMVNGRTSFP